MTINRFLMAFFLLLLALLLLMLGSLFSISTTQEKIFESETRRFDSYKLATELRHSSDDLTRMARLYVSTGNERFFKYFQEILDIRSGTHPRPLNYDLVYWDLVGLDDSRPRPSGEKMSLETLMMQKGFTLAEFRKLIEAQTNSNDLVKLETIAMNAVKGIFKDDSNHFTKTGEPDFSLARNIMFGDEYLQEKAKIMSPVNDFLTLLDKRTKAETSKLHDQVYWLVAAALSVCLITLLASGLALIRIKRKVLDPLLLVSEATEFAAVGNYEHQVQYSSKDEIGHFINAFNVMVQRTKESISSLEEANKKLKDHQIELELEQKKSEKLLLNILPAGIATRLKSGETDIADEFAEVSVMFMDLVGFTKLTEKIGPMEIVRLLNDIFALFDHRVEEFGLEKIKTIGDCYMVVSGIPYSFADHAHRIADFALAVQEDFDEYVTEKDLNIEIRMGIHSGAATAGIVGTKKFAYDLWGDVVNVASRMESTCVSGEIHVSEGFMIRLKDSYGFEARGKIDIKGKGMIETYFLKERKFPKVIELNHAKAG